MDVPLNVMNVSFNSMASDIEAGVTRGKTVMLKHFLLVLGIHSYTCQRKPVGILNRLGHCISYKTTCEIENAQAVKDQSLASQSTAFPIVRLSEMYRVLTVFWVDNFDIKVECQKGKNSVNATYVVAFQEEGDITNVRHEKISVLKSSKLVPRDDDNLAKDIFVNPKVEPPCILSNVVIDARDLSLLIAESYF